MVQFVFPEHANTQGTLYGGRLMDWIMLAGSINSSRVSKGITVLGATDSIDFITRVKVGEVVSLDSWVEHIGSSSLEVGVVVHTEDPESGERKLATFSHMAFIAVDKDGKPRKLSEQISPEGDHETSLYNDAKARKDGRLPKIAKRDDQAKNTIDETEIVRNRLETTRVVLPEDSFYGNFMSVGKLMLSVDEMASILAMRFVKGVLVTGSLDDLYFYSPIKVGNTSLEVGIKVLSENIMTGEQKHTCTAFLSFVHVGEDGAPEAMPEFKAETPEEIRLWKRAEERKAKRINRVKRLRETDLYI